MGKNIVSIEGFSFKFDQNACKKCKGNCCGGNKGYVWVNTEDIKRIADYLNKSIEEIFQFYIIEVHASFPFKEVNSIYSLRDLKISENYYVCYFFDLDKKKCKIYPARPLQCRKYPFWNIFKNEIFLPILLKECPGIILNNDKIKKEKK